MHRTIVLNVLLLLAAAPAAAQSGAGGAELATALRHTQSSGVLAQAANLRISAVPLAEGLARLHESSGVPLAFSVTQLPGGVTVSCSCQTLSVGEALDHILDGTGFGHEVVRGQVLIERLPTPREGAGKRPASGAESGSSLDRELSSRLGRLAGGGGTFLIARTGRVEGAVVNRATGAPIDGAIVSIQVANLQAITDRQGRFTFSSVPQGTHTLTIEMIGFRTATRQIQVASGGSVEANFMLDYQAISLDQVVVTGSIAASRRREMPVSVSVITSDEIERLQITGVDQLFRGMVPGVVSLEQGNVGWNTNVTVRGMNSFGVQSIKTYIDGVEVANPENIGMIDPASIDRIEVIRGPQASTLYGADAIGGVLQIFTKKGQATGLDRPRITLRSTTGLVEGDHAPSSRVIDQRTSLELNGGGRDFSYSMGITHNREGEWVEGTSDEYSSFSTGLRATEGNFTASASLRYVKRSFAFQTFAPFLAERYPSIPTFTLPPRPLDFDQQTMGLNLAYEATPRWSHNLVVGFDRSEFGLTNGFSDPDATSGTVENRNQVRTSVRYNTSVVLPLGDLATATLTGGVDQWRYKTDMFSTNQAPSDRLPGRIPVGDAAITLDSWTNAGYFGQVKLGVTDDFFLTGALRAEDNRNFGEGYGLAWAPRLGATYIRGFGDIEAKFRTGWGVAIRPPGSTSRTGTSSGAVAPVQPNPAILPEEQSGWEGGVDLVFGHGASLSATYFDQDVKNLIEQTRDFSVDPPFFQFQNLGSVKNRGWELEGMVDLERIQLRGTFTTTRSTVRELGAGYGGDLRVGDRNLEVPENVIGASVTYPFGRGSAGAEISRVGSWVGLNLIDYYDFVFGGEEYRGSIQEYWSDNDPITRLSLRTEQSLTDALSASLRINNLTNEQRGEMLSSISVARGRTVLLGLRYSF